MATPNKDAYRVKTPRAILSYPHLLEPSSFSPGDPLKYSCVLIFVEGTDLTEMKNAVNICGTDRWGADFEQMVKDKEIRLPWRVGEWKKKGYPKNSIFLSVKTDSQPGVVMPFKGDDGRPADLTDPKLLYPGAIVRASLEAYMYDKIGQGISLALNNVQWLSDGDRMDSRVNAADDFEAVEDSAGDVADLL